MDTNNMFTSRFFKRHPITERMKYSLIAYSVAFTHFCLLLLFFWCGIYPLVLVNLCSVAIYLFSSYLIYRESFQLVYYISCIEILIHTLIATICVGWDCGFSTYIIALIPVAFYMSYTLKSMGRNLKTVFEITILCFISYSACLLLSYTTEPFYTTLTQFQIKIFNLFNSIVAFSELSLFSVLFVLELRTIQSRLETKNKELEQLANYDPLTNLLNRRSMMEKLNSAHKVNRTYSIIMCDIDNFKQINDTYGHDFGDVVLSTIACLIRNISPEASYVCRWGGEEFMILLPDTNTADAATIGETIRKEVADYQFQHGDILCSCTLSLGVATHQNSASSMEHAIHVADERLYKGKTNGKNQCISQ